MRDTKPNLSNAKFEQFTGDTLTLSGRTEVHGYLEIENGGSFRLDDGNQQAGYVMTSDVTGGTSWQAPVLGLTGTTNGLSTYSPSKVGLGGTLCETTTTISGACKNLIIGSTQVGAQTDWYQSHSQCFTHQGFFRSTTCSDVFGSIAFIQTDGEAPAFDVSPGDRDLRIGVFVYTGITSSTENCYRGPVYVNFCDTEFPSFDTTTCSHITVRDEVDKRPMQYYCDYSANIGCRSIPDAQWVSGQISSATSGFINAANNGLCKISTNVRLGGTLLCSTTIDGDSGTYNLSFTDLNSFNLGFDNVSTITDSGSNGGLRYAADYCANYVARSIPDVAFVTGLTSGALTDACNGLTNASGVVKLGGQFDEATQIISTGGTLFGISSYSISGGYSASMFMNFGTTTFSNAYNLNNGSTVFGHGYMQNTMTYGGNYGAHCLGAGFCFNFNDGANCTTLNANDTTSGITITDTFGSCGLKYLADYSGNASPRWIPDYGAVTGLTSGLQTQITANDNDITYISGITSTNVADISYISGITDNNTSAIQANVADITYISGITSTNVADISYITGNTINTANNGLTKTGTNVRLGGTLTQATVIDGAGSYGVKHQCITSFCVGNQVANQEVGVFDVFAQDEIILKSIDLTGSVPYRGELQLESSLTCCSYVGSRSGTTNCVRILFNPVDGGMLVTDDVGMKGMEYEACYHDNYTSRSLVDKEYVDTVASGLDAKDAVSLATTTSDGDIDISGGTFVSGSTIDSVIVMDGWRVLIKNQTDKVENGIYDYSASASGFTRSTDFDGTPSGEVSNGAFMTVVTGTTLANSQWILTTPDPIVIDTTELTFSVLSQQQGIVGGDGIDVTTVGANKQISIDLASNSGLQFNTGQLEIDFVTKTSNKINQASHGFVVGDVVSFSGGTYIKSLADGTQDSEVFGLVTEVTDGSNFTVTLQGFVDTLSGLVANTTYFVSDTVAGQLTATEPTTDGHISKPILATTTSTAGLVLPYRGSFISTGDTSFNQATNGLSVDGTAVKMGGSLCENTTITLGSYSLNYTAPLNYTTDVSGSFGTYSLVDKNYVTGITSVISAQTSQNTSDITYLGTLSGITVQSTTGVTNGLTKVGNHSAKLGGTLSETTNIATAGEIFRIQGCNGTGNVLFGRQLTTSPASSDPTKDLERFQASFTDCGGVYLIQSNNYSSQFNLQCGTTGSSFIISNYNPTLTSGVQIAHDYDISDGIQITDSKSEVGMVYTADYSTNGITDPRWIPDYAAVTALTSSIEGGVTADLSYISGVTDQNTADIAFLGSVSGETLSAGNGLSISGNTVVLGGTLTGITRICTGVFPTLYGLEIGTGGPYGQMCASGLGAIAMGYRSIASGIFDTTIGLASTASGGYGSFAGGFNSVASGCTSFAFGDGNGKAGSLIAGGINSVAMGKGSCAFGDCSFAQGVEAKALGGSSFAQGNNAYAVGEVSKAIGTTICAIGDGSIVISRSGDACSLNSSIFGGCLNVIETGNTNAAIIGGNNITLTADDYPNYVAVPNLAIFSTPSAGGSNDVLTWDATSKKVGKVAQSSFATSAAGSNTQIQYNNAGSFGADSNFSFIDTTNTLVIGTVVATAGVNNLTIGTANYVGDTSVAIGSNNVMSGACSIVIGNNNGVSGDTSIAVGSTVSVYGNNNIAVGFNAFTSGQSAIALGASTACGTGAHAFGWNSSALGYGSSSSGINVESVGCGSHAGGFSNSIRPVCAIGEASFNHSRVTGFAGDPTGYGTAADYSAILGGLNNHIGTNHTGAAIIGGNGICIANGAEQYDYYTNVSNLAIWSTPDDGGAGDAALVWDSTDKKVKKVTQGGSSTLTGNTISGNDSDAVFTINHGCGTRDVMVQVYENQSPYGNVLVAIERPNTACITLTFDTAPATGENYRVLMLT